MSQLRTHVAHIHRQQCYQSYIGPTWSQCSTGGVHCPLPASTQTVTQPVSGVMLVTSASGQVVTTNTAVTRWLTGRYHLEIQTTFLQYLFITGLQKLCKFCLRRTNIVFKLVLKSPNVTWSVSNITCWQLTLWVLKYPTFCPASCIGFNFKL